MDWKEFLRPDLRKIVIFVFLAFILGILLLMVSTYLFTAPGSDCLGCRSPEILNTMIQVFMPLGLGLLNYLDVPVGLRSLVFLIIVSLDLIFWYFISCLIVWIYDKVRNK